MTKYQQEQLLSYYFNHEVYGYSNTISASQLENDKRKHRKIMRELVEAGYLSQTGEIFTITNKILQEIEMESVNLFEIWQKSRKNWNYNKNYDFIQFNDLTDGQKRNVLSCKSHFDWHLVWHDVIEYDKKLEDNYISEKIENPEKDLGKKVLEIRERMTAEFKEKKIGGYWNYFTVVLKKNTLTEYIQKTLKEENLTNVYKTNLKWGLQALGIVSEEEAKDIVTAEEPDWVVGGHNLGTEPEKWEEKLKEKIKNCAESIRRINNRRKTMMKIQENIEKMGGWTVFREKMMQKLAEKV